LQRDKCFFWIDTLHTTTGTTTMSDFEERASLRVYLAGAWGHREKIGAMAAQLELAGHSITYAWYAKSAGLDRRADALFDLRGVLACDVFVAVADDPAYVYRGTATELGIALGAQKPIYLVLPPASVESDMRKNVFVDAPGVTQLASWQDVLRVLAVVTRDGEAVRPKLKRVRLATPSAAAIDDGVTRIILYAQRVAGINYFPDGVLAVKPPGNAEQARVLPVYEALRAYLCTWARSAALNYAGLYGAATAPCECGHCTGAEAKAQRSIELAAAERRLNDPPPPARGKMVGVAGRMGAGKSSLVARLQEKHGGVELACAAPLYDVLHYAQRTFALPPIKDRAFLQQVGTEWGRALLPRVWELHCVKRLYAAVNVGLNAYVSDMRFPNEHAMMQQEGGLCVRVTRPLTAEQAAARAGSGTTSHASETALDGVAMDVEIANDGTLQEFLAKVDALAF